jgi:5-formyltetrahydrofolate cyclo-ligase
LDKDNLRLHAKRILSSIEIDTQSVAVSKQLNNYLQDFHDCVLGVYSPLAGEPLWNLNFRKDLQTAYPRPSSKCEMMYALSSPKELERGHFFGTNLKAPSKSAKIVVPEIILVPGLLFGKNGERLGRGGGYFDRYLSSFEGMCIGICFEQQISDTIIMDSHDCWMDKIITDHTVYECDRTRSI